MAAGVTTLPFDFDIFLRSGSTMKPEMPAFCHGTLPCSSSARSTVENNQVRMMSWPWLRSEYGNTSSKSSGSRSQPPAICGVSDEVAQVSMMSTSPTNLVPRSASVKPGGTSDDGSTGSESSVGTITAPLLPWASSSYQTGMGTPKKRWREMSQSPVSPPTQFS